MDHRRVLGKYGLGCCGVMGVAACNGFTARTPAPRLARPLGQRPEVAQVTHAPTARRAGGVQLRRRAPRAKAGGEMAATGADDEPRHVAVIGAVRARSSWYPSGRSGGRSRSTASSVPSSRVSVAGPVSGADSSRPDDTDQMRHRWRLTAGPHRVVQRRDRLGGRLVPAPGCIDVPVVDTPRDRLSRPALTPRRPRYSCQGAPGPLPAALFDEIAERAGVDRGAASACGSSPWRRPGTGTAGPGSAPPPHGLRPAFGAVGCRPGPGRGTGSGHCRLRAARPGPAGAVVAAAPGPAAARAGAAPRSVDRFDSADPSRRGERGSESSDRVAPS